MWLVQDSTVAVVERFWTDLRGQGLMLSARDVDLVERWEASGVPADAVCRALARAVEAYRAREGQSAKVPAALGYFRAMVEAELSAHRPAAMVEMAPVTESAAEPTLEERLAALTAEERDALDAHVDKALAPERKQLGVRGLADRRRALTEAWLGGRP